MYNFLQSYSQTLAVKNLNYSFMVKFAPGKNKLEKSLGGHFKASKANNYNPAMYFFVRTRKILLHNCDLRRTPYSLRPHCI